ncbi:MAG: uroporphyrinogen-III C-methyltransferase [Deltaproteobacteria bacterium]|nr:uroporphyrinogen-III C-methyltransferase [Deltaproteobacteria bacterium]
MSRFPVTLDLSGVACLVVGGGSVALRKLEALLAAGAVVTVVAEDPLAEVVRLAAAGRITLEIRPYQDQEARDYRLVFATTDDRPVNAAVFADAAAAGAWVNVADDPQRCTMELPARVERGSLQLAISTQGRAPFVARRLRQLWDNTLQGEWGAWLDAAATFRAAVRDRAVSRAAANACYDRFFAATVDDVRRRVRVPGAAELASWLPSPDEPGSSPVAKGAADTGTRTPALVSLIGAGPGDPGLLTVRGRERLLAAHAVVYDRLAATALPTDLPAAVELHSVGKERDHHPVPQAEINALLIRLATEGKRTARLKGGDPYVFGRGAEEAEALANAGIPFEVIPAATAAVAVPAYAGLAGTKRAQAARGTFLAAHRGGDAEQAPIRWDLLAADPHMTLVGYMGVTTLPETVDALLRAGMAPETPAAMIERGTTAAQRTVRCTVRTLAASATTAKIAPPALFVIGPTVATLSALEWYTRRPLFGRRLAMAADTHELAAALRDAGADVVEVPTPVTPAARVVLNAQPLSGFVFWCADEVAALAPERPRLTPAPIAWCRGPVVAAAAAAQGFAPVVEVSPDTDLAGWVAVLGAQATEDAE